MDRGAWQATVHEVTKSQTWLRNWAHSMHRSLAINRNLEFNFSNNQLAQKICSWHWVRGFGNLGCYDVYRALDLALLIARWLKYWIWVWENSNFSLTKLCYFNAKSFIRLMLSSCEKSWLFSIGLLFLMSLWICYKIKIYPFVICCESSLFLCIFIPQSWYFF